MTATDRATATTWEMVVGLEVHCELATATKLFCGCRNAFGDEPNTNVCPVCLGLPGSLPVLNRQAVELAMRVGAALHCSDRAVDLPPEELLLSGHAQGLPGQPVRPAAQRRRLARPARAASVTRVGVTRAHMEEDTGKTTHVGDVAGASTAPTTPSSTTTGPASRWSRS